MATAPDSDASDSDSLNAEGVGVPDNPDNPDIPSTWADAWVVAGFVFAVLAATLPLPLLSGVAGMTCGAVANAKGHAWGVRAAVVAGLAMVFGMSFQALIFGSGSVAA